MTPEGTALGRTGRIYGIETGTISVDPPSQGAAGFFSFTVVIPGVRVGDRLFLHPLNTLENALRLVGYAITAINTVTIRMEATAIIDGAATLWEYSWFDMTAEGGVP